MEAMAAVALIGAAGVLALVWARRSASPSHKGPAAAWLAANRSRHSLAKGLNFAADILYRDGGPETLEWHEVHVLELLGDAGPGGWKFVRAVVAVEVDEAAPRLFDLDYVLAIKDPVTRLEYRDVPRMAQFLRLSAGGINERDAADLPLFLQEREEATARQREREARRHAAKSRKRNPSKGVS